VTLSQARGFVKNRKPKFSDPLWLEAKELLDMEKQWEDVAPDFMELWYLSHKAYERVEVEGLNRYELSELVQDARAAVGVSA
jgi:hypothetical protein